MTIKQKPKLLLIDDSEETIKYLSNFLQSTEFEIDIARNGAEGLNMFDKIKPDITLLNLLMPVMDGFETMKKILQLDHDAKIIVTSAIDSHAMINRCLDRGALAYIPKPLRCVQFGIMLQYLLKNRVEKRINQMFLMLADKLQTAGRKLYDPSLNVLYYEAITYRTEKELFRSSADEQSLQISYSKNTEPSLKITIPDNHSAFIGKISGQEKGAIFCIFKNEDIKWFEKRYGVLIDGIDVIMCKMFSILSDNTGLTLDYELPRKYEESENITLPKEMTKAKFEFRFSERTTIGEIQLWFNISSI